MKKIFTLICGVLLNSLVIAQINTDPFKIVKILPNTPDVAELTKNAHASVSLHTGSMSQNIPLVTFSAKRLSVPISISYNSSGIKVDQVSSMVGLGWALNTGGFISRTVVGDPDENVSMIDPPTDISDPVAWDNFLEGMLSSAGDNQVDLFTFSVEGYSGTFVIENMVIRKLDENNLKIVGNASDGFVITTPKGIRYMFRDIEMVNARSNCDGGGGSRLFISNSWLLTKIEHPLGESVNFEYTSKEYSYLSSVSQTVARRISLPSSSTPTPAVYPFKSCVTTQSSQAKFLTRISSSLGDEIAFQYQEREDVPGSNRLESIIVKGAGIPLKTISFKYSYSTLRDFEYGSEYSNRNEKRLFLDSLKMTGQEVYTFDYLDRNSIPPRLSYAKDRYGFFNGKKNQSLIPKPGDNVTAAAWGVPEFADRTADGSFGQKGLLNSIHFPTGGRDSILFEPHLIYEPQSSCNRPASISLSGESAFKQIEKFNSSFSVTCSQKVNLHFACTAVEDIYDDQYYSVGVEIYSSDGTKVYSGTAMKNQVINQAMSLGAGNYSVIMSVKGPSLGNCEISYLNFDASAKPVKEVGGLRVKEIIKMDDKEIKEIMSYSYVNTVNGMESSQVVEPMPFYNNFFTSIFQGSGGEQEFSADYIELMTFSFLDYPQFSGNYIGYNTVTEKLGRNAENGSIVHNFSFFIDAIASVMQGNLIPGAPLQYSARKSGQEFHTLFHNSEGKLKKEVWNYYSNTPALFKTKYYYIANNRSSRIFKNFFNGRIMGVDVNKYLLNSEWNKLDSVVTTTYFDANGSTSKLVDKEQYSYGNLSHMLVTKQEKIASNGKKLISNVSYPDDYESGSSFINSMSTNYLKDYPIEFIQFVEKDGVKKVLKGDLINYSSDGNGRISEMMKLDIDEPLIAENFKFSNKPLGQLPFNGIFSAFDPSNLYVKKIAYNNFDNKNNPMEVIQEGNVKTTYIWSYNGQYPIAELKNTDYVTVANLLGGSDAVKRFSDSNPTDAQVIAFLAPLRNGLPAALITTYTYKPLIGMTSSTDAKGKITYYQYDEFQRLKFVKDQDENIIKSNIYHYKN